MEDKITVRDIGCGHRHNTLTDWGLAHNKLDGSVLLECVYCHRSGWIIPDA